VPETLGSGKAMARLESQFKRWLRSERPLVIYRSPALKEYSTVGETERDFRIRLQRIGNEIRDTKIAALRKRFDGKFGTLQNRLARAEHVVARESEQARGHQLDTAISFGTALLGAMLGRKRLSVTSATRIGAAAKKAGGLRRESGDVDRAKENVARIQEQIAELESAFEADARELDAAYDAQLETLKETSIAPKSADIAVSVFGIGWLPG
jgi:nitroreductase